VVVGGGGIRTRSACIGSDRVCVREGWHMERGEGAWYVQLDVL
jgi:hypothetical protein